ncbi:MOSC domain-containing protein [Lindgomyces ingoldianus]|uniref:MOSC domain-containing protein n=1 Tax=Lindgomyces ingoldianus TaxID=673940 RepID=A0ACB6RH90_9PLEO|nr:MOSC domain-containing protein [Lindgomyces ingoldianus]KAF2478105.1 MOSC domain-containing protein [Lindgomyces ingoldianus]
MKISGLYVYPVKSLRGTALSEALATRHGFRYDRIFMLLKVIPGGCENMAVSSFPEMVLFLTDISYPEDDDKSGGTLSVRYKTPGSADTEPKDILRIPLHPDTQDLEMFEVHMHDSPTKAFKMPSQYSSWFSSRFGYEVVFAYLGGNLRDVLWEEMKPAKGNSWLSTLSSSILGGSNSREQITFADCSPYLIVSKTSLGDVSSRLPDGEEMDMTKFRPNIVLDGAEKAWEEDFWGKVKVNNVEFTLAHNCVRCKSINVDYNTGQPGTGESGSVLKKLQKDRRVDTGARWSPVFGRYSFLNSKNGNVVLRVGDEVSVTQLNPERTVWSWKGLG